MATFLDLDLLPKQILKFLLSCENADFTQNWQYSGLFKNITNLFRDLNTEVGIRG